MSAPEQAEDAPLTEQEQAAYDRQGASIAREREERTRRKPRKPTVDVKAPSYAGGMYRHLPTMGGAMYTHPDDR